MASSEKDMDPPPKYEPPAAGYPPEGYQPVGFMPPPGSHAPPPGSYAPPPGSYAPPPAGYQSSGVTTVVMQPQVMALNGSSCRYWQQPALIVCQHCQATVTTSTEYETGLLTWAICGGICLVGLWAGCCLIPFCIDGTKDVKHKCPNCNKEVGRFRHFS